MKILMCSVAVAVVLIAACGSTGSGSAQPAGSTQVTMTEYKFAPATLSAPHGKVVFWLVNSGSLAHNMIIRDQSKTRVAGSELVSAGDSKVFTVDNIPAGTYNFICDQPGHEAQGMSGTLTIT
jgi:plastocyanin